MTTKKRYVQVGLGSRSMMYSGAVAKWFTDHSELVGLCDSNEGRLRLRADVAREHGIEAPTYSDDQFDQMIAETKPDVVIVATVDSTHDHYICRAMELGCDVMTEKPMTTDEQKCQRILDAKRETGRECRVTFNYRYAPARTQVKDLLMAGVIGNVVSVDFHWLLDTKHGADYFRRWHRNKRNSGGLMVHKATHHFDLVNWWLSTVPETVYATGARNFYRPETAERYGLSQRGERCLDCAEAERCPFYMDLRAYPRLRSVYLENEQYDEGIDTIQEAIEKDPENARLHFILGDFYAYKNQYGEAEAAYRECLKHVKAGYDGPHLALGYVLAMQKKYEGAVEAFQAAIKLNPKLATALYYLGVCYDLMGESKLAVKYFTECAKLDSPNRNKARQELYRLNMLDKQGQGTRQDDADTQQEA